MAQTPEQNIQQHMHSLDPSELKYKIGDAIDKNYQQKLQSLGLYSGKIDGAYGEKSEYAHTAYRKLKKQGLSDKAIFLKIKGGVEDGLINSMKKSY